MFAIAHIVGTAGLATEGVVVSIGGVGTELDLVDVIIAGDGDGFIGDGAETMHMAFAAFRHRGDDAGDFVDVLLTASIGSGGSGLIHVIAPFFGLYCSICGTGKRVMRITNEYKWEKCKIANQENAKK